MTVNAGESLLTDLYQLTMLQGYFEHGMDEPAVFEFFVRRMPEERGFLVAAGLEQVLQYLTELHFSESDLEWLATQPHFTPDFIDYLSEFHFRGDVYAMPEGTPFFVDEPIVQVVAPLPQAQLIERRVTELLAFQARIASKVAREVVAAADKLRVVFGLRRAHGAEAGMLAARASYLAGFAGSATVLGGQKFGIPVFGTMAHSFVLAHESEIDAFRNFALSQPNNVVLLIDTYDTESAAHKVVALHPELAERGISIKAVRLDSGDLIAHARAVRDILDEGGLHNTGIFVSGNLDENALQAIRSCEAPIDGFGVGTHLDTSSDVPYLDSAYKLQAYAGRPCRKRSEAKANWPARKQVYRRFGSDGVPREDVVALVEERIDGDALLQLVMKNGNNLVTPSLESARAYCRQQLGGLPAPLRSLAQTHYPVHISEGLQKLADQLDRETH